MATNELSELARRATEEFGHRVHAARKDADMSQMTLAQAMTAATGVRYHQTTVGRVERGTRPTSVGEAHVLAALLGVSVTDLIAPDTDARVVRLSAVVAHRQAEATEASERLEAARAELASVSQLAATTKPTEGQS